MGLLTGAPINIELLQMRPTERSLVPAAVQETISDPLLRQVFLRSSVSGKARCYGNVIESSGERLVYASSWWSAFVAKVYLAQQTIPIWEALAKNKYAKTSNLAQRCTGRNSIETFCTCALALRRC
jgi:chorismate--pyruvate lyase